MEIVLVIAAIVAIVISTVLTVVVRRALGELRDLLELSDPAGHGGAPRAPTFSSPLSRSTTAAGR